MTLLLQNRRMSSGNTAHISVPRPAPAAEPQPSSVMASIHQDGSRRTRTAEFSKGGRRRTRVGVRQTCSGSGAVSDVVRMLLKLVTAINGPRGWDSSNSGRPGIKGEGVSAKWSLSPATLLNRCNNKRTLPDPYLGATAQEFIKLRRPSGGTPSTPS